MQNKLRRVLFELHNVGLEDRGNAVASRTHPRTIDLVAAVHQRDRTDHRPGVLCVKVKLLAHRVERHLHVFDDGIAFVLSVECLFAGPLDRMLQQVKQTSDAGCFSLLDQLLASGADQQRLHVAAGLGQVEQLAAILSAAHFDDSLRLIESHVGEGTRWHIDVGCPAAFGKLIHDYIRLGIASPSRKGPTQKKTHSWCGAILKVDRFGNLITNFAVRAVSVVLVFLGMIFKLRKIHPLPVGEGRVRVQDLTRLLLRLRPIVLRQCPQSKHFLRNRPQPLQSSCRGHPVSYPPQRSSGLRYRPAGHTVAFLIDRRSL